MIVEMSKPQMSSSKSEVFVGGDGAARVNISSNKVKKSNKFSLNSIIDHLPKFCKDELCHTEMDDTFSIASLDASTDNGLNTFSPDELAVKEDVVYTDEAIEKKEKVPSPTGMMQSRTTKRRKNKIRSPQVRQQKTLSSESKKL